MKAQVRVQVEDAGRRVSIEAEVDGGSGYGRDPFVGTMEKALAGTKAIVQQALESKDGRAA